MPFLCRECKSISDSEICDYCKTEADWCETVYEVRVEWSCQNNCYSTFLCNYDYDSHDPKVMFEEDIVKYCYKCKEATTFTPRVLYYKKKISIDDFLENAYNEELKESYKKMKKYY